MPSLKATIMVAFIFVVVFGCKKEKRVTPIGGSQQLISLWDYKYKNQTYNSQTAEISFSPNKTKVIVSRILHKGTPPEIILLDGISEKRLSNNNFYEFSPVVNDRGDFAFAQSGNSNSISTIVYNGLELAPTKNGLLYNHLAINNKYLVFSCVRLYDDTNFIYVYDLTLRTFQEIPVAFYVQKVALFDESIVIIQGFNTGELSNNIYKLSIRTSEIEAVLPSGSDNLLFEVRYQKDFDVISPLTNVGLFNATYSLMEVANNSAISLSGNSMGRYSWYISYVLESYIKLYERTSDQYFLNLIRTTIDNLLATQNHDLSVPSDEFNPSQLWSTKKYSIDTTVPISLMVDNAKIIYPMLIAYNKGMYRNSEVLAIAESSFDYYEKDYSIKDSLYRFQKGVNFWADGIWMPNNQQQAYALCLLELFKATKKDKYRTRLKEMLSKFKSEIIYLDQTLSWNYWPEVFYRGWSTSDNLSINTPQRGANIDIIRTDDISHGGITIMLINEYYKIFGDVFNAQDLQRLQAMLPNMQIGSAFSRHISGLTPGEKPLFRNLPLYGWSDYFPGLHPMYKSVVPKIYPYFDAVNSFAYPYSGSYGAMEVRVTKIGMDFRAQSQIKSLR